MVGAPFGGGPGSLFPLNSAQGITVTCNEDIYSVKYVLHVSTFLILKVGLAWCFLQGFTVP